MKWFWRNHHRRHVLSWQTILGLFFGILLNSWSCESLLAWFWYCCCKCYCGCYESWLLYYCLKVVHVVLSIPVEDIWQRVIVYHHRGHCHHCHCRQNDLLLDSWFSCYFIITTIFRRLFCGALEWVNTVGNSTSDSDSIQLQRVLFTHMTTISFAAFVIAWLFTAGFRGKLTVSVMASPPALAVLVTLATTEIDNTGIIIRTRASACKCIIRRLEDIEGSALLTVLIVIAFCCCCCHFWCCCHLLHTLSNSTVVASSASFYDGCYSYHR